MMECHSPVLQETVSNEELEAVYDLQSDAANLFEAVSGIKNCLDKMSDSFMNRRTEPQFGKQEQQEGLLVTQKCHQTHVFECKSYK
jgi:hypothetical protein